MDALYPRLLVRDFPAAVDFYRTALTELYDVQPVKVIPRRSTRTGTWTARPAWCCSAAR